MKVLGIGLCFGVVLGGELNSRANEIVRPQNVTELKELSYERKGTVGQDDSFVQLQGAEVAWMNREALERDFPFLKNKSDDELREWILRYANISTGQLQLQGVRISPLPVDAQKKPVTGYRPPGWERAAVFEAVDDAGHVQGMIDTKGSGNRTGNDKIRNSLSRFQLANGDPQKLDALRTGDHSDGSMTFGEAIAETSRQQAEQRLYDLYNAKHGTGYQTVDSYFIIRLPGQILKRGDQTEPMAVYGRQAHFGRLNHLIIPDNIAIDDHGGKQGTFFGSRIDFGGVIITEPRLAKNFEVLPGGKAKDPQSSKAWAWGHDAARAFDRGDKDAVRRHVEEMTEPINADWRSVPHGQAIDPALAGFTRELKRLGENPPLTTDQARALMASDSFNDSTKTASGVDPKANRKRKVAALRATPENFRALIGQFSVNGAWADALLDRTLIDAIPIGKDIFPLVLESESLDGLDRHKMAELSGVHDAADFDWIGMRQGYRNSSGAPVKEHEAKVRATLLHLGLSPALADTASTNSSALIKGRLNAADAFEPVNAAASVRQLTKILRSELPSTVTVGGISLSIGEKKYLGSQAFRRAIPAMRNDPQFQSIVAGALKDPERNLGLLTNVATYGLADPTVIFAWLAQNLASLTAAGRAPKLVLASPVWQAWIDFGGTKFKFSFTKDELLEHGQDFLRALVVEVRRPLAATVASSMVAKQRPLQLDWIQFYAHMLDSADVAHLGLPAVETLKQNFLKDIQGILESKSLTAEELLYCLAQINGLQPDEKFAELRDELLAHHLGQLKTLAAADPDFASQLNGFFRSYVYQYRDSPRAQKLLATLLASTDHVGRALAESSVLPSLAKKSLAVIEPSLQKSLDDLVARGPVNDSASFSNALRILAQSDDHAVPSEAVKLGALRAFEYKPSPGNGISSARAEEDLWIALDWLLTKGDSSPEFLRKAIDLVNASRGGTYSKEKVRANLTLLKILHERKSPLTSESLDDFVKMRLAAKNVESKVNFETVWEKYRSTLPKDVETSLMRKFFAEPDFVWSVSPGDWKWLMRALMSTDPHLSAWARAVVDSLGGRTRAGLQSLTPFLDDPEFAVAAQMIVHSINSPLKKPFNPPLSEISTCAKTGLGSLLGP